MKLKKIHGFFPLHKMKWVFAVSASVVIGGVMTFGLVGLFAFDFNEKTSIYMLSMILPMNVVIGAAIVYILKHMEKYLIPLFKAFERVSDGDLSVRLDENHSGEYEKIYIAFNAMIQELQNTKQEMNNFVNNLTHEFKTPITAINGFADYLAETGADIETEERMQYLKVISEQSHRLSNMTQNILLLTKLEACQIITDKEHFSIGEQIRSCVILLWKDIEKKHIAINLPEDLELSYYGNAELLEQVWLNLIHNAIKFTPENGEIDINGQVSEQQIEVTITDNGVGMDKDTIEHIFDKYYQNDTHNFKNGNGIGLSIVKQIVELCHGTIKVSSEKNAGSTFTIILPLENER